MLRPSGWGEVFPPESPWDSSGKDGVVAGGSRHADTLLAPLQIRSQVCWEPGLGVRVHSQAQAPLCEGLGFLPVIQGSWSGGEAPSVTVIRKL
jgi:hypothetical protein